jgi:molybdopterin biosynthesis enzyme
MRAPECFDERLSLLDAYAWLDGCLSATGSERILLAQSFRRLLASPITLHADRPHRDIALTDGYATQAESARRQHL